MDIEDFTNQLRTILDQHIILIKSNSELLKINLDLMKEKDKYEKGFNILYEYFDSISDEEKPKVSKQLNKIGL